MTGDAHRASRGAPRMQAEQVADLLRRIPLFALLGEDGLEAAVRGGSTRTYAAGQIICHQGDPGDRLYVVLHGLVKVVFTSEGGDEIVLHTLGDGEAGATGLSAPAGA